MPFAMTSGIASKTIAMMCWGQIENFFARIKQYRAIATRYDRMQLPEGHPSGRQRHLAQWMTGPGWVASKTSEILTGLGWLYRVKALPYA